MDFYSPNEAALAVNEGPKVLDRTMTFSRQTSGDRCRFPDHSSAGPALPLVITIV